MENSLVIGIHMGDQTIPTIPKVDIWESILSVIEVGTHFQNTMYRNIEYHKSMPFSNKT